MPPLRFLMLTKLLPPLCRRFHYQSLLELVGQFSTKLNAQFLICELLLEHSFQRLGGALPDASVKFLVTVPQIREFVTKAGVQNMWNMLEQCAAGSDQYTAELDRMLDMILHVDAVPVDYPYRSLLTAHIQRYIAEYRVAAEAETFMARFAAESVDINRWADLWVDNRQCHNGRPH